MLDLDMTPQPGGEEIIIEPAETIHICGLCGSKISNGNHILACQRCGWHIPDFVV